ncbi:MAG: deoxyribonuclease IV [Eubacterium sp.]
MFTIGAHLSASKGYVNMYKTALSIGANTFQYFTRNPRGGKAKPVDETDINEFLKLSSDNGFGIILAHAPYTLNCCSAKPEVRQFALETFKDDISRLEMIPNQLYNFHPGSHVGQGEKIAIELIAEILNQVLYPEMSTTILLETMAGKGSEMGKTFEELRTIIDKVECSDKMGICLDTCHVNDGGYDIVNDLDGVLEQFNNVIGIDKLMALHLNDSKNPLGAHKDRHEKIGEGYIGLEAFEKIINHPQLRQLPMFLETPNELDGYAKEIKILKSLRK